MSSKKFGIDEVFRQRSINLRDALGLGLAHPTSQGDLSEGKWIKFLKSFLPSRFEVSKGFVFDSVGGVSDQIDVIVYDPLHSPLIFDTDNGEKYVTAESIYAVFEVKQKADKQNVQYADKKIQSVVSLKRTSRGMVASGKIVPPRELTKIIGGLLTTDSIGTKTLKKHIKASGNIDVVCSATTGMFLRTPDGVISSDVEETIPSFFYALLDELHKMGTVPAIDIRDYADRTLKSLRLERGEV